MGKKDIRRPLKPGTTPTEPATGKRLPLQPTLTSEEQFKQDYAYVLRDLQRIFLLAAFMFALLIILNLVIQ